MQRGCGGSGMALPSFDSVVHGQRLLDPSKAEKGSAGLQ